MVVTDMINLVKDTVLIGFEWINNEVFYEYITKNFRNFPEGDPIYAAEWGGYFLFLFVMFLFPACCGLYCNCCQNLCIFVSVFCFVPQFWKCRPLNESCVCQIIAEIFMIGVLVGGVVVVVLLLVSYFDFYQVQSITFDMAYNHMNTTSYPVTAAITLTDSSAQVVLIFGLIIFGILYNLCAAYTLCNIFCGFSCVCGSTFWCHYCSSCLVYFTVIFYVFLAGIFFCLFFFVQDFCRFGDIMWPAMYRILKVWISVEPFSEFTGNMINHCIDGNLKPMDTTYCGPFFDGWERYICKDANYFINGGLFLVSLFIAQMFCCIFFFVCYVGNVVRGDKMLKDLSRTDEKIFKHMKKEEKRMENYYLALGETGLENDDENDDEGN